MSVLDGPVTVTTRRGHFRADIQGLRAIAIVLIVAYHAGIPGFSGGFVGVDVFFVISGFLITKQLLRHSDGGGSVDFRQFWARRIRRLVPGLGLMIVITLAAGLFVIAPFDMLETAKEGGSATLYVSNFLFAKNTQDYFGSNPNKSPFLHTWSLSVEEQFYLIWPFLVAAILWFGKRSNIVGRQVGLALFALTFAVSLFLCISWTDSASTWAFFSLPARAWEFAAGALVGFLGHPTARYRPVQFLSGSAGIALLGFATVSFNSATPYPGVNALVPVGGTTLLLWAGCGALGKAGPVSRFLSAPTMQATGRISYSWYLWHWPFIVLAVLEFGDDGVPLRTIAAIASLGAAYIAMKFVENPFRFNVGIIQSARRTYLFGLAITVVVLATAGGVWELSSARSPHTFTQELVAAGAGFFPHCQAQMTPSGAFFCYGGDREAMRTVALVGDSHSSTWFNALSTVAQQQRVRVLLLTEPGCPFIAVSVLPEPNGGESTKKCSTLRSTDMSLLEAAKPEAVILTQHSRVYLGTILDGSGSVPSLGEQTTLWKNAFGSFLAEMMSRGIRPAVILDNPTLPERPASCVSRTDSVSACEPTRSVALGFGRPLVEAEQEVLGRLNGIPVLTPDRTLCTASGCPLEIRGKLAYIDTNHLTFQATRVMEPQLSAILKLLMSSGPPLKSQA